MPVLVLYATAHGSTRGIAEHIARRLRRAGIPSTARPAADEDDGPGNQLATADAVVLGSAIHEGRWLPDATELAERHAAELRRRPLWLFSVSSLGEGSSFFGPRVSQHLRRRRDGHVPEPHRRLIDALAPIDHHHFAGAIAPGHWGRAGTLLLHALGGRFGDHRNWDEVDRWADSIAERLVAPASAATATLARR